jgi:predicted membrane protein
LYVIFFIIGVISVLFNNSGLFIKRVGISSLLLILAGVYTWISMQLLKFNIKARALTIISFPIILLLLYPFSLILIPIQMYTLIIHTRTRKQFAKDEKETLREVSR